MNLIKVATGLFWLEIPEKDLFLMCGCPMDSIKHLENMDIIHRVDMDNYYMESGPNAILLSDLAVQNGYFCNLAEFPILHMMYKQGMALPGHPGNKGTRPQLIGISDQVEAQKKYIFRGNYGLASKEEFADAGCSSSDSELMWNLKMKFNFNTIHEPEALVETTVISDKEVELRPGVFLKRKGLNLYTIRFNNEFVDIDLNLNDKEQYEPPYQLQSTKVSREYFSIIHMGEGNGWDNSRPCMGSIINFKGKIYLIDAGPNIEYSLNAIGISVNDVEGIFHTHIHDDHFAGLTYLIMADHKIKYYATEPVMDTARKKLSALMGQEEGIFDAVLEPVVLESQKWNDIDGLEIKPILSPHPVETSIFYFRVYNGESYKTYGHLADIISRKILKSFISKGNPKEGITEEFYNQVWQDYLDYADIKKVDVGGGMVHGEAEDFLDDPSEILILSHMDRPLNDREKNIGINVEFGTQHILIPSSENYTKQKASRILCSYFPEASADSLKILLDCPFIEFPDDTVIAQDSTKMDEVFLIISGRVHYLFSDSGSYYEMTSGSAVGLMNGLWGDPIQGIYRTASHVEALVISKKKFNQFLSRNKEMDNLKKMSRILFDIQSTYLLGSRISNLNLVRLAQRTGTVHFLPGDTIPGGWSRDLYLLKKGRVEIYCGNKKIGALNKWDSWGGYPVYPIRNDLTIEARIGGSKPSELYRISYDVLKDIPVVQWNLFQTWSCWEALS